MEVLLERYDELFQENERLRESLNMLQQQKKELEDILSIKENELSFIKAAQSIQGSNQDSLEATRKINTLIKELDWCIAKLSD